MILLDTDEGKVKNAVENLLDNPKESVPGVTKINNQTIIDFMKNKGENEKNVSLLDNDKKYEMKDLNKNTIYILCVKLGKK